MSTTVLSARFDALLDRLARPGFVLRMAALILCLLELGAAAGALLGRNAGEPYDGLIAALYLQLGGGAQDLTLLWTGLLLTLVFAAGFWGVASRGMDRPQRHALPQVLGLGLLALLITPGLPFLVTALAAVLLRPRPALLFAAAQVALNLLLYWLLPSETQRLEQLALQGAAWAETLKLGLAMLALHGMAFGLGRMAALEAEKRRWLQVMLAEKRSAEQLQAEQLRYAERLLLARELHDVVGHHLTALNLQLQLGEALLQRDDKGGAALAVHKAGASAAALLADVRAAVSQQRNSQRIDLSHALQALAAGIATPQIMLQLDAVAQDLSPRLAHALLRCAQEALTNSVRHAGARQFWIALSLQEQGSQIRLLLEDDGLGLRRGSAPLRPGNGLQGMGERIAELGGQLQWRDRPAAHPRGPGFTIDITVPRNA